MKSKALVIFFLSLTQVNFTYAATIESDTVPTSKLNAAFFVIQNPEDGRPNVRRLWSPKFFCLTLSKSENLSEPSKEISARRLAILSDLIMELRLAHNASRSIS